MRLPTQATSLQISTSHSQYLAAAEATATSIKDQTSLPKEGFATITATRINSETYRGIVWQTPNVVMDGIPTTFVTVTANAGSAHFATAQHAAVPATGTQTGRPLLEPAEVGLPDWSPLLTIFLLTWVAMAWILALVIFLATFPEKVAWLDRLLRRRPRKNRHEYVRSKDDASDLSDFGRSALNPTASTNTYRSRKIRDVESSIQDTATVATGLGISFNGMLNTPRLRRPRSFDRDSLHIHDPRPHANIASTAPLPSNRSFAELSPTSTGTSVHVKDLESGDYESSVHRRPIIEEELISEEGGIVGVLESVNAVIEFVADRLARMTSDRVTDGAERGLLLPVKENERAPRVAEYGEC
jgi:hypothetical protein